jgi:hypothetical protein
LAAPQIDTKIRIRREALVAGGPKRSAAQRRNGSGRSRSAGVASRCEYSQAKNQRADSQEAADHDEGLGPLPRRCAPEPRRAVIGPENDNRRNGERNQRIRRQPRAPHLPVAFLLPPGEGYETGVEKRAQERRHHDGGENEDGGAFQTIETQRSVD